MKSENIKTDNRLYDYTGWNNDDREDYKYVVSLVKEGSSIIDLGCGNGSLIQKLIKEKNVRARGVELSPSGVEICKQKGLDVTEGRIDTALPFKDNEFDYAICNVTMQMVMYPEILLSEMKRISSFQIISFPNLGFYKNRLELLFKGRMPKSVLFGFEWYNTGHIHLFSNKDFENLIKSAGSFIIVKKLFVEGNNNIKNTLMKMMPNLFQLISVYLLKKEA